MASISKISVQVAANAKQFDSTFETLEEKLRNFGKAVSDAKIQDGFNRLSEIGRAALDSIEFDKKAAAGAFAIISAVDAIETRLVEFQAKAHQVFSTLPPLLGGTRRPLLGDGIPDAEWTIAEKQKQLGSGAPPVKPPEINIPTVGPEGKDFLNTMNKYPQTWRRHFDGLGKTIKSALSELYNGGKIGLRFGYKLADGMVQGASGGLRRLYDSIFNIRNLIVGLAFGAVAFFIKQIISSNVETLEFSKRIGTAASDVSALDFAIQQTGHPIESMREGLQDLALQLAKLGRGDILVADMFAQIGLSVKDLRDKNPAETFKLIAERISRIQDPARQAGAAVRIFGKEAIHLLPLLQQGAGGIEAAMQKAKNLGLLVDDSKLEKLKEGGIAIANIRRALDGIVLQLATNLAPVFGTLIELASKWVQTLSIENAFKGVEQISLNLVSWFLVSFNTIRVAFIELRIEIIEGFEFIGQKIMRILAGLANSKMVKSLLGDFTQEFADLNGAFRQLRAENSLTVRDLKKLKVDIINDPMNTLQGVKDWFGKMNVELAKGMKQLQGENKGINQANINEKFFEQAGKMAEQTLQPLEIFQQKIRDIQELMEKTGESKFLKRSQLEAMNQLASSLGADQTRLASSDRLGSAAAVSAYNQSRFEREVKTETPAKRLERLQKEGTESLKQIEKYSEETSKALKNFKQVTIP